MIPVIKNENWFELLKESPKFVVKACNRKTEHDVYVIAVQDEYVVLYDTQHESISTHKIHRTTAGKPHLHLHTCGHVERIWLDIAPDDPKPVAELVIEPKKKAGRLKKAKSIGESKKEEFFPDDDMSIDIE